MIDTSKYEITYNVLSQDPASSDVVKLRLSWAKSHETTETASTSVRPPQMLSWGAVIFAAVDSPQDSVVFHWRPSRDCFKTVLAIFLPRLFAHFTRAGTLGSGLGRQYTSSAKDRNAKAVVAVAQGRETAETLILANYRSRLFEDLII